MEEYLEEYLNEYYLDVKNLLTNEDIKFIKETLGYACYSLSRCIANFAEEFKKEFKKYSHGN